MNILRISGPSVFNWHLSPENTAVNLENQSEISKAGLQRVMRSELGPNCTPIKLTSVVILPHCVCVVCLFLLLFCLCLVLWFGGGLVGFFSVWFSFF